MDSVKIIIFDEEELTQTLVENYLKELIFPFSYEKYSEFDLGLIENSNENQIIILNINKCNISIIDEIAKLPQNNYVIVISYDGSTDLQVKSLKAGAKDFLLKPLTKTDFVYSLQQVYKNFIYKNQHNEQPKVFSVISSFENDGKTTFTINTAKETADISKEKVLIIDVVNSEKRISDKINVHNSNCMPFFSEILDDDVKLPQYNDSELYILTCNSPRNINENIFKSNLKILKKSFKFIFLCFHQTDDNALKKTISDYSDEVFYIIPDNISNIEKLKSDVKYLNKPDKINLVLNQIIINDLRRINYIQTTVGQEAAYKISKNFMALEKAERNRITLNEVSSAFDISQEYKTIAKSIVNKV